MATQQSGMGGFFKEFWLRLTGPSPIFFKILQKFFAFILFLAGLALVLEATGKLPQSIAKINDWIIIAGAAAGYLTARLPTVDKDRKVVEGELPYTAAKIAEGKEPIH